MYSEKSFFDVIGSKRLLKQSPLSKITTLYGGEERDEATTEQVLTPKDTGICEEITKSEIKILARQRSVAKCSSSCIEAVCREMRNVRVDASIHHASSGDSPSANRSLSRRSILQRSRPRTMASIRRKRNVKNL